MTSKVESSSIEDPDILAGRRLHGDDFSSAAIERWYADEENAYYELAQDIPKYEYDAFNRIHAFDRLKGRSFSVCLGLGCADGKDIEPLAAQVGKYIALEPAEKWWRNEIGGRPADFVKPAISGDIPIASETVDLALSLGVLHHIPNVTHVVRELARVTKSGGMLIIREPIFSMGDWREPRRGLTARERGIPHEFLARAIESAGYRIVSSEVCMVPVTPRLGKLMGIPLPYDSRAMVWFDRVLSALLRWNIRYHRKGIFQKLAPTSVFISAVKT